MIPYGRLFNLFLVGSVILYSALIPNLLLFFVTAPDDFPKPLITEEPQTQVALSGSDVALSCKAVSSSSAPMSFKWRRNNRDLTEPAQLQEVSDTDLFLSLNPTGVTHTSQLLLSNVSLDASALYQCIVSNDFGTAYSKKANLSVYSK